MLLGSILCDSGGVSRVVVSALTLLSNYLGTESGAPGSACSLQR
jgi:hypothetical protein